MRIEMTSEDILPRLPYAPNRCDLKESIGSDIFTTRSRFVWPNDQRTLYESAEKVLPQIGPATDCHSFCAHVSSPCKSVQPRRCGRSTPVERMIVRTLRILAKNATSASSQVPSALYIFIALSAALSHNAAASSAS